MANWHAAGRAVERLSSDLSVHLGDISLDGQTHPDGMARHELSAMPAFQAVARGHQIDQTT